MRYATLNISLNIILDQLSKFHLEPHLSLPSKREFSCAELLPAAMNADLRSDKLYFGWLSQALPIPASMRKDATIFCLRDRIADSTETDEAMNGIVVIHEEIDYELMFSHVQNIFCDISQWYLNAQDALIKNRPLQDIVDLSEALLKNYVQITDSSFNLLAYTRHIDCDEEITVLAREFGYHPESTVKLFSKYHRPDVWDKASGTLVNDRCDMCKYPLLSRIFKYSNTYFAHAVMTCNNFPATQGRIELFEMFTDLIGVYVEKEWVSTNNCHHTYDAFLTDLYEGRITRHDIAQERSRHLGISLTGSYCIVLTSRDESGKISLRTLMQDISTLRPKDKLTKFRDRLAVLCQLSGPDQLEQLEQIQSDMESVMEKYDLRCGISAVFTELMRAPQAITQAYHTLACSGRTPGAAALPSLSSAPNGLERRAVSFEDSFIYILLGHDPNNKTIWQSSAYYDALKTLQEYDRQHNVNNFSLLYIYLICESRPTDTANALFMSRNNVVYRIERIQEMLQMDLKNAAVRFKLLMSYVLMQLYGLD